MLDHLNQLDKNYQSGPKTENTVNNNSNGN